MYYVYILTNKTNTVLYTGITNDLERRLHEHRNKVHAGFTSKYNINKLVYCAFTNDVNEAIAFEKRIKGWRRSKKIKLIETQNPEWNDLTLEWDSSSLPCHSEVSVSDEESCEILRCAQNDSGDGSQ